MNCSELWTLVEVPRPSFLVGFCCNHKDGPEAAFRDPPPTRRKCCRQAALSPLSASHDVGASSCTSLGRLVVVVRLHARHCAVHWACSDSGILVIFSLRQCSVIQKKRPESHRAGPHLSAPIVRLAAAVHVDSQSRGRLEANLHSIVDTTNFS